MLHQLNRADLRSVAMPPRARKPEVPAFGRLLKSIRIRRFQGKWPPERVATHLRHELGIPTSGGSIRGYEKGWNKTLDPVVLGTLADLYHVDVAGLIDVLKANRKQPDLSDFEVEQILRGKGRSHEGQAAASHRFEEIGQRLAAISAELQGFAFESADLTETANDDVGGQTSKTRGSPPKGDPDH